MSTGCMNDDELLTFSRSVHADGRSIAEVAPHSTDTGMAMDEAMRYANEQARFDKLVDSVKLSMPEEATPNSGMDSGTKTYVAQGANLLQRLINVQNRGLADAAQRLEDNLARANGTSYNQASWWLNVANKVYRVFQDSAAALYKFGQVYAGSDARNPNENVLNSAILKGQREFHGFSQTFMNWLNESYMTPLQQLAKQTGKDIRDLGVWVGHYASARHAIERNPYLRERWEGALAAERLQEKPDVRLIQELGNKIALFDQYRDVATDIPPEVHHAGYTDGEARAIMDKIALETGLTHEQLEQLSDGLCSVYQKVQLFRGEHGILRNAEKFPPFEKYVPLVLEKANLMGAVNDAHIYSPEKFHSFNGMTGKPASAYESLLHYMNRTATEAAYQDAGQVMLGLAQKSYGKDVRFADVPLDVNEPAPNGMRILDVDKLYAMAQHGDGWMKRYANATLNSEKGGGIVVEVPKVDRKSGETVGTRRVLVQWDEYWQDDVNGFTGAELNRAFMGSLNKGKDLTAMAKATGFMGQFYTRLNPLFAPVNTIRDFIERGSNLIGLELFGENGERINGSSILPRYLGAATEAESIMRQVANGTLQEGSPAWQMWQDYVADGLHQEYTRGINRNRVTARDIISGIEDLKKEGGAQSPMGKILNDPRFKGAKQAFQAMGEKGSEALKVLDNQWNDRFNNIAPLAEYIAMRKAGVTRNSAANAVLSQMNLYQKGDWTGFLQCMFPFVKPSVQSFTAAMRTLGSTDAAGKFHLNKRGIAGVIGMTGAYMALAGAARASLGTDPETGIDRFDQLSISELQRGLPIGINGGTSYLRFPTGYGLIQPIIALTVGMDRALRGIGSTSEAVSETMFSMVKNAMPANWPEYDIKDHPLNWIAQAFTPTLVQPIVEQSMNLDRYGRKISFADPNGPKAMADQGGLNVPKDYHDLAKLIHSTTGADFAPEQIRTLIRGYAIGPARVFSAIMDSSTVARAARSESATQTLGPFLTAMGASLLYGNTYDTGKAMFYNALDTYNRRIRQSGVEVTSKSYGSDRAKKDAFLREQLPKAGFSDAEVEDYITIDNAVSEIRKKNKTYADQLKPLWQADDDNAALKAGLKEYAEDVGSTYDNAVNSLHYYRGLR